MALKDQMTDETLTLSGGKNTPFKDRHGVTFGPEKAAVSYTILRRILNTLNCVLFRSRHLIRAHPTRFLPPPLVLVDVQVDDASLNCENDFSRLLS